MRTLELLRVSSTSDGQFGVLRQDNRLLCLTLERPWENNERCTSSIPPGGYHCVKVYNRKTSSLRPIRLTYEITAVPKRTGILFHPGNTIADTKGCILLGQGIEGVALTHSVDAFSRFIDLLREDQVFTLIIRNI